MASIRMYRSKKGKASEWPYAQEPEVDHLPQVCAKCGEPSDLEKTKTFSRYPPLVLLLIFALPVYIILAIVLTRQMTVRMPLCNNHRNHWFTRGLVIWLGLIGLVIIGIIGGVLEWAARAHRVNESLTGLVCGGGGLMALAWLITIAVMRSTAIRPTEITDRTITLTNVAPEFAEAVERLGPGSSYPSPRGDDDDDWDGPSPRGDDDDD